MSEHEFASRLTSYFYTLAFGGVFATVFGALFGLIDGAAVDYAVAGALVLVVDFGIAAILAAGGLTALGRWLAGLFD